MFAIHAPYSGIVVQREEAVMHVWPVQTVTSRMTQSELNSASRSSFREAALFEINPESPTMAFLTIRCGFST